MVKTCTKCGEIKPLDEFHNRTLSKDGKKNACIQCSRVAAKKWRQSNQEHVRAYEKRYREENKDAVLAATRRWRESNPEHCRDYSRQYKEANKEFYRQYNKEYGRAWYQENRERHRKCAKLWAEQNRDKINERARQWRLENRDHRRAVMRQWEYNYRRRNDVKQRLAIRRILQNFLRATTQSKSDKTHIMLGYSHDELCAHLERQFTKGMSWENYGEWHIDHIISVAEHIRNGETDPAIVNCLTNLRPMWAADNMRKSDKRTHLL